MPTALLPSGWSSCARLSMAEPCSICSKLERVVSVDHQVHVPPELKRLGIEPETEHAAATCPECGNNYVYSYTREYDDMTLYENYRLERLRPAPDPARLEHPNLFVRTEAAWSVCGALAEQARWGELAEMLRHPQAHVRREAVLVLKTPLAAEVVEPLSESLEVPGALPLLARHHAGDPGKIQALLDRLEPLAQAELLTALPDEALSPFAGLARELLRGPAADQAVGLLLRTGELPATLQAIRELWTPAATRLWCYLAERGEPVAELAPEAAARMHERWCSLSVLKGLWALGRRGQELSFALAPLCALLQANACSDLYSASWILHWELERGPVASEVIATLGVMATRPRTARDFAHTLLNAAHHGHDLSPAVESLRQALQGDEALARDYAVAALTAHWTAVGSWDELKELLRAYSGPCATELAALAGKHDWAPLVGQVQMLANSGEFYVSGEALKALTARDAAQRT